MRVVPLLREAMSGRRFRPLRLPFVNLHYSRTDSGALPNLAEEAKKGGRADRRWWFDEASKKLSV